VRVKRPTGNSAGNTVPQGGLPGNIGNSRERSVRTSPVLSGVWVASSECSAECSRDYIREHQPPLFPVFPPLRGNTEGNIRNKPGRPSTSARPATRALARYIARLRAAMLSSPELRTALARRIPRGAPLAIVPPDAFEFAAMLRRRGWRVATTLRV
jgi:hypothetical protein